MPGVVGVKPAQEAEGGVVELPASPPVRALRLGVRVRTPEAPEGRRTGRRPTWRVGARVKHQRTLQVLEARGAEVTDACRALSLRV